MFVTRATYAEMKADRDYWRAEATKAQAELVAHLKAQTAPRPIQPAPVDADTRALRAAEDTFVDKLAMEFQSAGLSPEKARQEALAVRQQIGTFTQPDGP